MNTGLISTRYATALLDYAIELNQQEQVYGEVKMLLHMYSQVENFRKTLTNPVVLKPEKKRLIQTASGVNISKALQQFIDLLLQNNREERLQYIILRFLELYRTRCGIVSGTLTTAVHPDEKTYKRIASLVEKKTGHTLELERQIDPSILGGFILQVGDFRWDASILTQLDKLKINLLKMNKSG